jgi:hypothetical protein
LAWRRALEEVYVILLLEIMISGDVDFTPPKARNSLVLDAICPGCDCSVSDLQLPEPFKYAFVTSAADVIMLSSSFNIFL